MKESFEDKMTNRIRDVVEHYEPEYSPQAWEEFREQLPAPQPWWKRFFLRYRYWMTGIAITGALVVIVGILSHPTSEKEVVSVQENPRTERSPIIEKSIKAANSEGDVSKINTHHKTPAISEEESISAAEPSYSLNDSLPVACAENNQMEYHGHRMSNEIGKKAVDSDLLKVKEFSKPIPGEHLIPIKIDPEKIFVNKSASIEKSGGFKLKLPAFNLSPSGSKAYNRFVGPNRFSLFYSPELHHSDSLKTIGVSQGAGISLEGPIYHSVLFSIGVSYQSMNYNKTISSVRVPVRGSEVPSDTTSIPQYTDSLEIRSGHYKFLELPVSVSYRFIESEKSQAWIGVGISSIAFLGQEYNYETRVGGISSSTSISVNPWKNIYPLASLNLSLLYRYRLSDRLFLHGSIQYKHHLADMGYNSMKLNRLNLQIGLVYRFGRED